MAFGCRGLQLGRVLLLDGDVIAGAEAGEVAADERAEGVAEGLGGRFEPAGDVLRLGQVGERHPAGKHDIHQHEHPLGGQVGEDVAGGVVGAVAGELDPVPAGRHRQLVLERDVGKRAVGVCRLPQQAGDLALSVEAGALVQDHGAGVVGVVVAVDGVGDWALVTLAMARRMLLPMVGGASTATTPRP